MSEEVQVQARDPKGAWHTVARISNTSQFALVDAAVKRFLMADPCGEWRIFHPEEGERRMNAHHLLQRGQRAWE